MVECPPHRRWLAAVGSLLSALALQIIDASQAGATCGDWLAHPGESHISASDVDASSVQLADESAVKRDRDSMKLPISKPCHGPFCRSAPFQPVPAGPVSISLQSDRLALFGQVDIQVTPRERYRHIGEPAANPTRGFPSRIDHPPRA